MRFNRQCGRQRRRCNDGFTTFGQQSRVERLLQLIVAGVAQPFFFLCAFVNQLVDFFREARV